VKIFVGDQKAESKPSAEPSGETVLNPGQTVSKPNYTRSYLQDQTEWATQEKANYDKYDKRNEEVASIEPSTLETWTAAFEETNSVSAWVASTPRPDVPDIDGYSPFAKDDNDKSDIDGYEKYADSFSDSFNPQTTATIKANINREIRNQTTLANGGALGVAASVAAGVADPINLSMMLLPGYGQANMWKVAGESMAIGVIASSAQEIALHTTQETRTLEESMFNIGVGAVADGLLGAGIHALTKTDKKVFTDAISTHLKDDVPRSVGAAEVASYGGSKGAKVMETINPLTKITLFATKSSPIGRTLQSDSAIIRGTAQDMVDHQFRLEGDAVNATSVESLINLDYAKYGISEQKVSTMESKFIKAGGTKDDFNFQLADAMRNGDVSDNAIVQQAAKELRVHIDETWNRAAAAEVEGTFTLNKDGDPEPIKTKTAASYMTRRKDINAIRNNPTGYQRAWIDGLKDREIRYEAAAVEEGLPVPPRKTEEEWDEIGREIYNRDINLTVGDINFNQSNSKIPTQTKERVDIRDEYLNDYLVKDWRALMDGYMRSMAPKARMSEKFGTYKLGELETRMLDKVKVESEKITDAIAKGGDTKKLDKQLQAIKKRHAADIRDLNVMAKRLMNEIPPPSIATPLEKNLISVLRSTRAFNVASMLGNVLVSSIPDVARQMTYTMSTKYVKALAKNFNAKSIKLSGISTDQMSALSQAMEKTQSVRIKEITQVDDQFAATTMDKYASAIATKSLQLTGFQHWNSFGKGIAGSLYGDRVAVALIKGTDGKKLNQLGFDDGMIREMATQAKQHSTKTGGLYDLNIDLWDIDVHIKEAIEAAAVKESRFLVTTPGAGDLPIMFDGELAKTVFQFQSFAMAATNRIMLPLLQESSVRSTMEIMTHMMLGYAAYELKSASMGRSTEKDSVKDKTWNAINHTGLLGYLGEVYRRQYAFTGIDPTGIMDKDRKFVSRGGFGAQLGPSAGTAKYIWQANPLNTMTTSEQKAKAARRLMPLQNNWLLRHGYDQVEAAIKNVMPDKIK
jgi:hypothetical protein